MRTDEQSEVGQGGTVMERHVDRTTPFLVDRLASIAADILLLPAFLLGMTTWCSADVLWGVNGHPFNAYPGISIEQQLDYVRDLGMTSYRVNISNADSADKLAMLVEAARKRGIQILPVITPDFDLDNDTTGDLYGQAYRLATTLVSRFKNDIRVWELGNEMENYAILQPCEMRDDGTQYNCSWGPAGGLDRSDYFSPRWAKVSAVLRGLSDATTAVDPTIRKALGTAGWGHRGAFMRMLQDGIRWDISVWHLYEGDPGEAFKFLASFGKPIWLTEFNYSGGSQAGERQQAEGLVQAMALLRKYQSLYDVQAAHVYELLDEPYWAPSYEAYMGLVRLKQGDGGAFAPDGQKLAYTAMKQAIADHPADTGPSSVTPAIPPRDEPATVASAGTAHPCSIDDFDRSVFAPANQAAYAYCLILHRMPSPAEQWSAIVAMKKDPSILPVLSHIAHSAEFTAANLADTPGNAKYVANLYRLLLRREPDNGGLSTYVSRLKSGEMTSDQLVTELLHSYEFRSTNAVLFNSDGAAVQ
jgi:hypothetical protein